VLRACARGEGSRGQIARRFRVGESTVYDRLRLERAEDRRRPEPHAGGRPRVIDGEGEAVLKELVAADNDATLAEYAVAFTARSGHEVSVPMVCKALKRLGLGRKKDATGRRAGPGGCRGGADSLSERAGRRRSRRADLRRRERHHDQDDPPLCPGAERRAASGERARGAVPCGSWRRVTLLGALGLDGVVAMMSVEAATSTPVFLAFLDHVLVPELARRPGATVIMDNLAPHKAEAVRERIEGAGLKLRFLPRYSPDLSPIEPCWSKIKALLRAGEARSVEALDRELPGIPSAVSAQDARDWFRHCGYATPD
jgi:transposase